MHNVPHYAILSMMHMLVAIMFSKGSLTTVHWLRRKFDDGLKRCLAGSRFCSGFNPQTKLCGVPDDSSASICLRFLARFKRFDLPVVGGSDRVLKGASESR